VVFLHEDSVQTHKTKEKLSMAYLIDYIIKLIKTGKLMPNFSSKHNSKLKIMKKTLVILVLLVYNCLLVGSRDFASLDQSNKIVTMPDYSNIEPVSQVGTDTKSNVKETGIGANDRYYIVVRFHKVEPGQHDEYLKTLETYKKGFKILQEKGGIRYWLVYRRIFPSGSDSEYDYISVMGFNNGEQMEAYEKRTNLDFVPGASPEDAARFVNVSKVLKIVKREVYASQTTVPEGKAGKYIRVNGVKVFPGKGKVYEGMIESTIPLISEAIKSGKMTNRTSWLRCFPLGSSMNEYSVVTSYADLTAALNSAGGDLKDEYKKVFPKADYETEMLKWNDLRTLLFSELWEAVITAE